MLHPVTLKDLAAALRLKRLAAQKKGAPGLSALDDVIVGLYTRCEQCGKPLFMDDRLIVDQSASVEKFLDRCAKRLLEHRCDSGSKPQI